jgi:hypothetical protein
LGSKKLLQPKVASYPVPSGIAKLFYPVVTRRQFSSSPLRGAYKPIFYYLQESLSLSDENDTWSWRAPGFSISKGYIKFTLNIIPSMEIFICYEVM